MNSAITMNKTEVLDALLNDFSEGYFSLSGENRRKLLLILAREHDLNRTQVHELIKQYLGLEIPHAEPTNHEEESRLAAFYRVERNLRQALKPMYEVLFERLNTHPGGLRFLSIIRADIVSILEEESIASLRALDSYLKEKLITWLSPAALELHQITWDDPASLLEKIVAYEAVHPISNLIDLKRRLGVGRRCFGYLHPAIPAPSPPLLHHNPSASNTTQRIHTSTRWEAFAVKHRWSHPTVTTSGYPSLLPTVPPPPPHPDADVDYPRREPLIFIEVALMKNVAQTIQEVLWDDPPIPECEATCALFYSISSTQPGLKGINLGKFLIKRVIDLVKKDMPNISTFATLSPIPGYMQWLLSKLASAERSGSTFRENILEPEEERSLLDVLQESADGKNAMEIMWNLLTSTNHEWTKSERLISVLEAPLMRLCARYLLKEKKRGRGLDSVANFHLQNGAMVGRLNWMADQSEKGLLQSGGIMVNYVYRLENIEENAQSYFSTGHIHASCDVSRFVETGRSMM
ncbi:hypothetical protein C3L33_15365, partial [Rhododendron williamsianum]